VTARFCALSIAAGAVALVEMICQLIESLTL
jgi:hypothetical protein